MKENEYILGKDNETTCVLAKDYILVGSTDQNVDVRHKADFAYVKTIDIQKRKMINHVQVKDRLFIGTNQKSEVFVFSTIDFSSIGTITFVRGPQYMFKISETHFLSFEHTNLSKYTKHSNSFY